MLDALFYQSFESRTLSSPTQASSARCPAGGYGSSTKFGESLPGSSGVCTPGVVSTRPFDLAPTPVIAGSMRLCSMFLLAVLIGCGSTKNRIATEQLLVSDAVDLAVSELDFRPLAGRKVFFDTKYIKNVKGIGFVNSEYIVSSLRQQMIAADCRLQTELEEADYVVEARVGTVGTDANEIVYGIPASNALASALSLVPSAPIVPSVPEISLARKDAQTGAAKLAVFAYNRSTGQPVWQSGISKAKSTAKDYWVLGAGPFQRGTIYKGTQFAGERIRLPDMIATENGLLAPPVAYFAPHMFRDRRRNRERIATLPGPHETLDAGAQSSSMTPRTEQWLAPLQPKIVTPAEASLDRSLQEP